MTLKNLLIPCVLVLAAVAAAPAHAQSDAPPPCKCPCPCPAPAPPPPPPLTGSLGAGLSVTTGNSDTSAFNLDFGLVYDPKTHSLFRADALYLRSAANGDTTSDKATASLRYEYKVSDRFFAFGQLGYLHDRFKDLTYLLTPMVGGGYVIVKEKAFELAADASIGGAFEKDSGLSAASSGAFAVGESFAWKISPSATFTQKLSGLWKTNNTSNAFYHFEVGLAASLVKSFDLKVAYLIDYKNIVPPTLKKTDTALIAAIIYKF
jgi:putative salt-induced outer membrane protein YdiY